MKLSISNIGWPVHADAEVAQLLRRRGVSGIEVAPTKVWPSPIDAREGEVRKYHRFWRDRGIEIVALQALFYGRPDLTLFETANSRKRALEYLKGMISLAAMLEAKVLVFGSPKNRKRGQLPLEEALSIAEGFFSDVGRAAEAEGVSVCLEANPTEYGADFVVCGEEALKLVERVGCPGFRLHLDTACMTMCGDPIDPIIERSRPLLNHFHISEPYLNPIGSGGVNHARFSRNLQAIGYDRWVSIEMRMVEPFHLGSILDALTCANGYYTQA